jgi:hypothetical protein
MPSLDAFDLNLYIFLVASVSSAFGIISLTNHIISISWMSNYEHTYLREFFLDMIRNLTDFYFF